MEQPRGCSEKARCVPGSRSTYPLSFSFSGVSFFSPSCSYGILLLLLRISSHGFSIFYRNEYFERCSKFVWKSGVKIILGKHNNTKNDAPEAVIYLWRYPDYFLALFVGAGRAFFFFFLPYDIYIYIYLCIYIIFRRFLPLIRVSSTIHQEDFHGSYA